MHGGKRSEWTVVLNFLKARPLHRGKQQGKLLPVCCRYDEKRPELTTGLKQLQSVDKIRPPYRALR